MPAVTTRPTARTWYIVIAVIAAVLLLAYLFGLFGGGEDTAPTTAPAPATGTTG